MEPHCGQADNTVRQVVSSFQIKEILGLYDVTLATVATKTFFSHHLFNRE